MTGACGPSARVPTARAIGVTGLAGVEQVKVSQGFGGGRVFGDGVLPLATGQTEKPFQLVLGKVGQGGIGTSRRVKGAGAQASGPFQMIDQAGVEGVNVVEAAADQLRARPKDERAHFGMATMVVLAFHIDETRLTQSCGLIELVFGGRQASSVFMPVFLTEQPDVNGAPTDFVEIDLIGATVRGGQVFKQEHVKESAEQGITANVITNGPAFFRQLLLHTADENALVHSVLILSR